MFVATTFIIFRIRTLLMHAVFKFVEMTSFLEAFTKPSIFH